MGKKGPMTAEEVHKNLMQDPQYRRKLREFEAHKEESKRKYSEAARPLLQELAKSGLYLNTIDDLIYKHIYVYKRLATYLVPTLLRWLPRVKYDALREDIIRTLGVPWARPFAKELIKEFKKTSNSNEQWVIGNALAMAADDRVFPDILKIAKDKKKYGNSRTMVVSALGNMINPENREKAIEALIELLINDDMTFTAIQALKKLKATRARPYIEKFLVHPDSETRNEAKKAIKSLS